MKTVFSEANMGFTKRAHLAAQTQFYSRMYPAGVEFVDAVGTARDLEYAIDCQLAITVKGLRAPISMAVQERFRRPSDGAMKYGDITVTEWNLASNQPSELHKLSAQMFVYGFYDETADHILLAVAVDVGFLQWALAHDEIRYVRQKRGDQSFLGFQFRDLQALGAVLFVHDERAGQEKAS